MPATYDLSTPIGQVRLRIPDTNTANPIFQDEEIQHFLDQNGGNIYLAAADALEVIAGDPARVQMFTRGSVMTQRTAGSAIWQKIREYRSRGRGIVVGTIVRSDFWGEC